MALVLFLAFFLLSHLLLPSHGQGNYNLNPKCPSSFNNNTNPQCGLCQLNCSGEVPKIQPGNGPSCEFLEKLNLSRWSAILFIRDQLFEKQLDGPSCEDLNDTTIPSSILHNITVFKCPKSTREGNCKDYDLYYTLKESIPVPTNHTHNCEVIHLPVGPPDPKENANLTDLFYLVTAQFDIELSLIHDCWKCHNEKGRCLNENKKFKCENTKQETKKSHLAIIITAIVGSAVILTLCLVIFIIWRRYNYKWSYLPSYFSSRKNSRDLEDSSVYFGVPVFSYTELEDATNNFDPAKELGDGGFGAVYYGKLRDGREVAVKRLYENNYKRVEQFMNEVEILTRLHHTNLVLLYGCTSRRSRELLLVYEYIPNGTVADHLHGDRVKPISLPWPIRMNIAVETASALAYLHASEIIHRDVKTSNILLDKNFHIKVADFGISRLLPNAVSHISTVPQGTPGYVDPEYHQCYQLTDKSDVYSFGVVLIELISSMPAVDINRHRHEINLANLAITRIQRCAFNELIDPDLGFETDATVKRMTTSVAELAFRCLQFDKEMRPTMKEVLEVLKEIQEEEKKEGNDSVRELTMVKLPPLPGN